MRKRAVALSLFLSVMLAGLAQAEGRPLTAMDLAMMDRVSDPHISPDGSSVVYSLRSTDYAANKAVNAIWLLKLGADAKPVRLAISSKDAASPRWSPDGRSIYFLSPRSGSSQVWKTDSSGDTAVQVTYLPLDVGSFELSPDGQRIVVSVAVFPDCETPECTAEREKERKTGEFHGVVFDRLYVRYVSAWVNGTRSHLFSIPLDSAGVASGAPVPLMAHMDGDAPAKKWGTDADYDISSDGRSVFFSTLIGGKTEAWSDNSNIWRSPIDGSAPPVNLTAANPGPDVEPVVSPDGRYLAYCAGESSARPIAQFVGHVWIMDLANGTTHELAPSLNVSCFSGHYIDWAKDGRGLVVNVEDAGTNRLVRVDVTSGDVSPLTTGGTVESYDAGAKAIVFVRGSFVLASQLYQIQDGGQISQLTDHNAQMFADVRLTTVTPFNFRGWNGDTVQGFVFPPYNYIPGHKYPVAFLIHGGPQEAWDDSWTYRWNPQAYAGAGYAVVMINFHGSSGYGDAFTDAVTNHGGDRPLEDLQKGWAYALANFSYLDGSRACALGPSFGGYMVDWIAGVWNKPWRCLVSHDGIFDNRMMSYTTDVVGPLSLQFLGATYEHPENYERFNPINHVADWSKPILVIHSGNDFRVPLEQGLAAFTAAQRRGIPSEFLYFPDEEHAVLKPQDTVQWQNTIDAWLDKWAGK